MIGLAGEKTIQGMHLPDFHPDWVAHRVLDTGLTIAKRDGIWSGETALLRRDGREINNHFKWLAAQFPVTFLFVGVGLAERQWSTEGSDPGDAAFAQTARRWTTLSLDPFDVGTDAGRQTWRRLLKAIERDLVLIDGHRGMLAEDLADYLFARSTGHFASLMTLIARGCRRAIKTGAESLTPELLDGIRNDVAAEAARQALEAAIKRGVLTTRVQSDAAGRRKAA